MPILSEEPSLYPEDLFDDAVHALASGRRWWAFYTMARQEKALARQLLRWQVPYCLPLMPRDNRVRARRVRSYVPLFSGYVFVLAKPEQRDLALSTGRVSRVLSVSDQEELHHDLRQVCQVLQAGALLTVEPLLVPGRRVRVREGVLEGLEGSVISHHGRSCFLIAVNFLQQGASVAIDSQLLESID